MVSASMEFSPAMRRQIPWNTQWIRRVYNRVPRTIRGVGIRAMMASCQFIRNRVTPMPIRVNIAITMSWKPWVMNPCSRSVSLVTRVMMRPVLCRP